MDSDSLILPISPQESRRMTILGLVYLFLKYREIRAKTLR